MIRGLISLLGISICCALLLGFTYRETSALIEVNRSEKFWQQVKALTNIDMPTERIEWHENIWHLCNGLTLIRGETRGYGGPIHLLAALKLPADAQEEDLAVVRGLTVTQHQETPGIADFINQPEHSWLQGFVDLTVDRIDRTDTVTGATITSRAIQRGLSALANNPNLTNTSCLP